MMILNERITGRRGDATGVELVSDHAHVATFSPIGRPAVLDNPVVCSVLGSTIAHDQNCMVQIGAAAAGFVVHARAEV